MIAPAFPGWVALAGVPQAKWLAVKDARLSADPAPEARDVNAWVNRTIAYVADAVDHWQAPQETLDRGAGDCEDYAVLKRGILLARGWPAERLALVVGQDLVKRCDHAVLWVDGQVWDNLAMVALDPRELVGVFRPKVAYGVGDWVYGQKA